MHTPEAIIVLTTLPDQEAAEKFAAGLIENRLAACVNVLSPARSHYRWRGAIQADAEVPLLIKTVRARYAALEAWMRANHPYELPEIVAVPIERGLPAYLDWLAAECQPMNEE